MKLYKTNLSGNPNVGLYAFCTDSYCLLAPEFTAAQVKIIEKVLNVPVYQLRLSRTSLLGALVTGNSKALLVPSIVFEEDRAVLERLKLPYTIVPSRLTALGNNILCNDVGALVNPEYSANIKKLIRQTLQTALHPGTIADTDVPGSCAVHNKQGAVLHAFASEKDINEVEALLQLKTVPATVNFGNPYVHSGLFANSYGMVIGDKSTAIEIENIYEALRFLK
jgi:translation initiation factor 6